MPESDPPGGAERRPSTEAPPPPERNPPALLLEYVARIASAAALELDVLGMVDVLLDQTCQLGASMAALFMADPQSRELALVAERGLSPELVERLDRIPLDAPLITARAARSREVQLVGIEDVHAEGLSFAEDLFQRTGISMLVAAPLVAAGELVGVIAMAHRGHLHFPERELIGAIRAISDICAASLAATRAHERHRAELEAVRVAALAMSAPVGLPRLLQTIVDQARVLASARYAALGVVDPADPDRSFRCWVASGVSDQEVERIGRIPRPVGLLGAVARGGETLRLKNVMDDERFRGFPAMHPTMNSFLGVPICLHGEPVGNLYLAERQGADEFSEDDQHLVELLAQHAALALERTRKEEQLAEEVARREREGKALLRSEERFRRLAECAPDVISRHRLDPSLTLEYMSPAVEAVLGHPPEDYYRDSNLLRSQVHPFDRGTFEAGWRTPARSAPPINLRWVHPSGRIVWTETRLMPIREGTHLVGVEAITRDVTERTRREAEVERVVNESAVERNWLETVIASSPTGIVLIQDRFGRHIRANREAERLFGRPLPAEGGIDQFADQLSDPSGARPPRRDLVAARALQGETTEGEERICRRPDGREIPVLAAGAPVLDERGSVAGAVLVYRDISVSKELESMRQEWTSIIAHDLRQPVTTIALQASILAKSAPESAAPRIAHIRRAADHLDRMIADLLDASRLEARQLSLEKQPLDIVSRAREVVSRMDEGNGSHPVRIDVQGDVPLVLVDGQRFEQILVNLLSNAIKFARPGTPIDVGIRAAEREVIVSVSNEGEGIAPRDLPNLFSRFHTPGRPRPVGGRPGVGLGLYITKGLVDAHGGRIAVESDPGGTTTFSVALPLERVSTRVSA